MSIVPDILSHMGGVPVGMEVLQPADVRWVYSSTTAEPYLHLSKTLTDANKLNSSLSTAEAALTGGRNDTIFLTPETHTLTAAVTWDLSNTHLIGMHSGSRWANNCKITHTSALSINNMIAISGSDNIFQIYTSSMELVLKQPILPQWRLLVLGISLKIVGLKGHVVMMLQT